jgi:quercetin dioxygenase-like cupin family protein
VLNGRLTFRYADHDEVYDAGDAYYAPPGHVPVVTAGTEVVEFSPTEEYSRTMAQVAKNLEAMSNA